MIDKIIELSRAVVTERRYGESNGRAAADRDKMSAIGPMTGTVATKNRGFLVVVERFPERGSGGFTGLWTALAKRSPERGARRVRSLVCRRRLAVMAVAVVVPRSGASSARA